MGFFFWGGVLLCRASGPIGFLSILKKNERKLSRTMLPQWHLFNAISFTVSSKLLIYCCTVAYRCLWVLCSFYFILFDFVFFSCVFVVLRSETRPSAWTRWGFSAFSTRKVGQKYTRSPCDRICTRSAKPFFFLWWYKFASSVFPFWVTCEESLWYCPSVCSFVRPSVCPSVRLQYRLPPG